MTLEDVADELAENARAQEKILRVAQTRGYATAVEKANMKRLSAKFDLLIDKAKALGWVDPDAKVPTQ